MLWKCYIHRVFDTPVLGNHDVHLEEFIDVDTDNPEVAEAAIRNQLEEELAKPSAPLLLLNEMSDAIGLKRPAPQEIGFTDTIRVEPAQNEE